jgi:hypothetical protein
MSALVSQLRCKTPKDILLNMSVCVRVLALVYPTDRVLKPHVPPAKRFILRPIFVHLDVCNHHEYKRDHCNQCVNCHLDLQPSVGMLEIDQRHRSYLAYWRLILVPLCLYIRGGVSDCSLYNSLFTLRPLPISRLFCSCRRQMKCLEMKHHLHVPPHFETRSAYH